MSSSEDEDGADEAGAAAAAGEGSTVEAPSLGRGAILTGSLKVERRTMSISTYLVEPMPEAGALFRLTVGEDEARWR